MKNSLKAGSVSYLVLIGRNTWYRKDVLKDVFQRQPYAFVEYDNSSNLLWFGYEILPQKAHVLGWVWLK
jgi:hypothetical protein